MRPPAQPEPQPCQGCFKVLPASVCEFRPRESAIASRPRRRVAVYEARLTHLAWAQDELRSGDGQIEYLLRQAVLKRRGGGPPKPPPAPPHPGSTQ